MTLILAGLWADFVGTHLAMSHPPARAALVARLGDYGFLGAYSAVSFATFGPLVALWWLHRHEGTPLWMLRGSPVAVAVSIGLALAGFFLLFGAFASPPPSSLAQRFLGKPPRVRGMTAVTRHPLFVGMSLWAVAHVLMNGWGPDVAFFGGFP